MNLLRKHLTLALCTALHAFTHAYGSMLVPLYLLMVQGLSLRGVGEASAVVTIYSLVYFMAAYPAGVLADRYNRKWLLAIGHIGNAAAIALMGLTSAYSAVLLLAIAAGLCGTLFHPAANGLVPAHYPRNPGMAIGLLGAGSGVGFFLGPQYAGWRAQAGGWQVPCLEMGLAGIVFGLLFLLLAREVKGHGQHAVHPPLGPVLRWQVAAIAVVLACRDFAGIAAMSLTSIYLQKAFGRNSSYTGTMVGTMMLIGVLANPLAVWLSPGRRRLPSLSVVLLMAAAVLCTVPLWPLAWMLPVLCLYATFQLGSYAISDAAILERVPAVVRGRVVGVFLTIAGGLSSAGPWTMGLWSDHMQAPGDPRSYLAPFAAVAALLSIAAASPLLIRRLGPAGISSRITPASEIDPATLGSTG